VRKSAFCDACIYFEICRLVFLRCYGVRFDAHWDRWLVSATRGHVGVILFGLPLASSASNSQFASLALLVYTHKHQQEPVTNLPSAKYLPDGLSDSWVSFRS
jgi:hypothetical protein